MSKEFLNKNGHYFYKLILVITFLVFILLLVKDVIPFASQNAYYHSVFGSNLFSNFLDHSGILQQSQFHDGYVDQHIGFHFLVWISNLVYSPEWAIKMLTCLFLSLTLFQLIRSEKFSNSMLIFSSFLFFLFFQFNSFQRLFWERPQFLNLFVFVYYFYNLGKSKNKAVLFFASLGFSLVSFETGIWVIGLSFVDYFFGAKRKDYLIVSLSAVLISLFIFPFGFAKAEYVITLLKNNLVDEQFITEWAGAKEWKYQHLILTAFLFMSLFVPERWQTTKLRIFQMSSLLLLLLSIKIVRFEYVYFFLIFLCFIEFLTHNLRSKSKYFVSFLLLLGFAYYYPKSAESFKGNSQTIFNPTKFIEWYQQSKYSEQRFVNFRWEYWSSLFYYDQFTKSEPGFSMFIYRKNQDIVKSYNYLRYHLDEVDMTHLTYFFSSFNSRFILVDNKARFLKIYKEKKWPLVPLYTDEYFTFLEFRDPRSSFNGYDQKKFLAEDCLLLNRCSNSFLKRTNNKNQVDVFIPIPEEDSTFPLIPFSLGHFALFDKVNKSIVGSENFFFKSKAAEFEPKSEYFYEYPFYRIENKWILAEKNLLYTRPTDFLNQIDQLFERELKKNPSELFYIIDEPIPKENVGRPRRLLGVLYLCMIPQNHHYCFSILEKYDFSEIEKWDLGSKSILGLIEEQLSSSEIDKINTKHNKLFSRLPGLVSEHYDVHFRFWYGSAQKKDEILTERDYVFAVGEALSYLSYKKSNIRLSWLNEEIDKYFFYFDKKHEVYSIRWLLSILANELKNPLDRNTQLEIENKVKHVLNIILAEFYYPFETPLFFRGCFYNKSMEGKGSSFNFDHHSGLILEGLSFFSKFESISDSPVFKRLVYGFSKCTLKQQIRSENFSKIGANKREMGGVRIQPGIKQIRIDVLAHLGIGLNQTISNEKLRKLISNDE